MAILRAAMVAYRFLEARGTMQGHSHCVIIEDDASNTIDGIPVAYEGHKTSCREWRCQLQQAVTN